MLQGTRPTTELWQRLLDLLHQITGDRNPNFLPIPSIHPIIPLLDQPFNLLEDHLNRNGP
jgi:hypothetical protein